MAENNELTDSELLALVVDVHDRFYDGTESFRDQDIGAHLAYLMGAIASNSYMVLFTPLDSEEEVFHRFLKVHFPTDHKVWQFIRIEEEE